MPKKPSGEIGITKISATSDGQIAEVISIDLPDDKEGLEKYFADKFVYQFNKDDPDNPITIIQQNDTTDLDFNISGSPAKYLELAEIAPYSEEVGKSALEGQWINVYDFSKWIWKQLIAKKQERYGGVCKATILLVYVARWEFYITQSILHSLIWTLRNKGCSFHEVFLLQCAGEDAHLLWKLHPNDHSLDHPRKFKENRYLNERPGTNGITTPSSVS